MIPGVCDLRSNVLVRAYDIASVAGGDGLLAGVPGPLWPFPVLCHEIHLLRLYPLYLLGLSPLTTTGLQPLCRRFRRTGASSSSLQNPRRRSRRLTTETDLVLPYQDKHIERGVVDSLATLDPFGKLVKVVGTLEHNAVGECGGVAAE